MRLATINASMIRAIMAITLGGFVLAVAFLAALGVPAPRLIATGCDGPMPVKLARYESELPRCETVQRLPWIK